MTQIKAWIRAMRIHQWSKNLLIFIPTLAAHQLTILSLEKTLAAFISFCSCASAIYIINDIVDLKADRAHVSKNQRPFAAGVLKPKDAWHVVPVLLMLGLFLALQVNTGFLTLLLLYIGITQLYTFGLKRLLLIDVFCLAGLYTLRIFAGGIAATVPVSKWLLAFSVFFFLSLALSKRASELIKSTVDSSGRQYTKADLPIVTQSGVSSGYLAALVLVFYINSSDVQTLYAYPDLMWGLCLLLLYWVARIWVLTTRGAVGEDPVLFAVSDKTSQLIAILGTIIILVATKWPH